MQSQHLIKGKKKKYLPSPVVHGATKAHKATDGWTLHTSPYRSTYHHHKSQFSWLAYYLPSSVVHGASEAHKTTDGWALHSSPYRPTYHHHEYHLLGCCFCTSSWQFPKCKCYWFSLHNVSKVSLCISGTFSVTVSDRVNERRKSY